MPLVAVVTENMRRIRTERGLLQEDVAMAARWVGLMWSSITVTQIESGSRQLSLDEVLLLPLVLRCSLKDLLDTANDDDPIQPGYNPILEAATVRRLVAEKGPRLSADDIPMLPGLEHPLDPRVQGPSKGPISNEPSCPTCWSAKGPAAKRNAKQHRPSRSRRHWSRGIRFGSGVGL